MANLTNNNKLIDEINSKLKQVNVMPTADVSNVWKVIQYIGPDDDVNNFFNWHFYRCISDGQDPTTYSWEEIILGVTSYDELTDKLIAGNNITIEDKCTISGTVTWPCDNGFHIPTKAEWDSVILNLTSEQIVSALHIPYGGIRRHNDGSFDYVRSEARLWVSNAITGSEDMMNDYYAYISQYATAVVSSNTIALGCNIRAFKNAPVVPDATWTETVEGKVREKDGLISILVDTDTYVTMQNKNVGATTVWNTGDTVSSENIGDYFQWGNNHGFKLNSTGDTSSTQVDASSYWPGEYDSDTFVIGQINWMSVDNYDLWWAETGCAIEHNVISAVDIITSYNDLTDTPISLSSWIQYYNYISTENEASIYSYWKEVPDDWDDVYFIEWQDIINYSEYAESQWMSIKFKNTEWNISVELRFWWQTDELPVTRNQSWDIEWDGIIYNSDYKKVFKLSNLLDVRAIAPQDWDLIIRHWDYWINDTIKYDSITGIPKAWENIYFTENIDPYYITWPCDDWYHIPTVNEIKALKDSDIYFKDLLLPKSWFIDSALVEDNWIINPNIAADYWTVSPIWKKSYSYTDHYNSIYITEWNRSIWCTIRPFANDPVEPDETRTVLKENKVWHNENDWLITVLTKYGYYITMADKNLGATTVWNPGDQLSSTNRWHYFQRGNNYWFSADTKANISFDKIETGIYDYRNPYESSTFIWVEDRWEWSTITNNNLWWASFLQIAGVSINANVNDTDSDIAFATITLTGREVVFNNAFITNTTLVNYTITNGWYPNGTIVASVDNGSLTIESSEEETNLQFFVKFEKANSNSTILS